jgi:hypothetical protein
LHLQTTRRVVYRQESEGGEVIMCCATQLTRQRFSCLVWVV